MATLDEIFASIPDTPASGAHELLIINPDTRRIEVPEIESIFGVETDGNAERKYFQCPRYVGDNIDLTKCKLRVAFQNASGTEEGRDGYLVNDVTEADGYVYFSWKLSPKVCQYKGAVEFAVCVTQGTAVVWHTTLATGTVLEGMDVDGEEIQTGTTDVIAQLLELVEAQCKAVEAAGAAQVQKVEDAASVGIVKINAAAANAAPAIVCAAEGAVIQVSDASERPLQGLRIFGRSTQDGTPTPDNPVEIVSTPAPVVTVCGKNLCATESVQLTGAPITLPIFEGSVSLPLVLSWTQDFARTAGSAMFLFIVDGAQRYQAAEEEPGEHQLAITDGNVLTKVAVLNWGNETGTLVNLQLESGAAATEYEPYTGQTLAVANGLPGIPVTSGGNYTDADGQQWICDEVDLSRGVYVQRIALDMLTTATYYASGNLYCKLTSGLAKNDLIFICSHAQKGIAFGNGAVGAYTSCVLGPSILPDSVTDKTTGQVWLDQQVSAGEPITVGYILAAPVEIPLTEDELAAYAALHSVKPTTTILNDSGAHMAVEYVADTKLYIDKKIAELITANNT